MDSNLGYLGHIVLYVTIGVCTSQPHSTQGEHYLLYATNVIDIKCSDYISAPSVIYSHWWIVDYCFKTVAMNHLQIQIEAKWRNVGRLLSTCTIYQHNYTSLATAKFKVQL